MPFALDESLKRGWIYGLKRTGSVVLPVFLLIAGIITTALWSEIRNQRQVLRQNAQARVTAGRQTLLNTLLPAFNDLHFIARMVCASGYLAADAASQNALKAQLETQFVNIAASHGDYDQIRVIDATGMERVRVGANDGAPAPVPDADLQMVADRPYVRDTMRLAPGKVYLSPLDLNVVRGRIEVPLKPMLRLATPIAGHGTGTAGMVIVNYRAAMLLDHFAQADRRDAPALTLLNSDGYWLKGPSPDDAFGFMFPNRKDRRFQTPFPTVWQHIQAAQNGQLLVGRDLFTFATLFPLRDGAKGLDFGADDADPATPDRRWIVVAHHPGVGIGGLQNSTVRKASLATLVAMAVLALVTWRLLATDIQQRRTDRKLRQAKAHLETTVQTRTGELEAASAALSGQVDERRRIEQALRESEAKYRAMMEAMRDYALICSTDHTIEYVNPAMAAAFSDAIVGRPCYDALFQREAPCATCQQTRLANGAPLNCQDLRTIRGRDYHVSHNPIHHADGSISVMSIFRDVSDLKAAEAACVQSERQFRSLVETMHEGIFIIDNNGRLTFVNERFSDMLGYPSAEIVGCRYTDFLAPGNADGLERALAHCAAGDKTPFELAWIGSNGDAVPARISPSVLVNADGTRKGSFAVVTDVSDQKRIQAEKAQLEAKLRQAQKMEAIGVLAGGIAHDFNNILMPIMGYTELINASVPEDDNIRKYVRPIMEASQRAKELVHQILSFSRQSSDALKPTMIAPLVSEPLKLLKASIPSNIRIEKRIMVKDAVVLANPVQIHQVVMNLCTNAYHAMESTGGKMVVSLDVMDFSPAEGRGEGAGSAPHVRLTVADTGPGIQPDSLPRIFEPYFTTKGKGKGTGLGLSVVHGIVTACGGEIRVHSDLGKGTTFTVYLPLVLPVEDGREKISVADLVGGSERILLVDDEAPIVNLEKSILERLGYTVTTRLGSLQALDTFEAEPDAFDLVITDLTMPNLTGLALAEKLVAVRGDIPIIMLTGFSEQLKGKNVADAGIRRVIMKPALTKDLAEAIRQVLDGVGTLDLAPALPEAVGEARCSVA